MPRALTSLRRRLFLARMRRRVGARHFAAFGPRSVIVPPAVVVGRRYIHLGDEVLIHDRVWFSVVDEHNGVRYRPRLTIGDRARIGRDVWFSCVGTIEVGADVLVGDGVLITDTYHEYRDVTRPISAQPMAEPRDVRIGAGALLGINSAILAGVTIGPGAFVGAGAVVTDDVPAHAVAAGNPARVIRHWDAAAGAWREGAPDGPGG